MATYVNAGAYQQWNWNTNTQSINMDAVNHERDRQAFIAADMQRGSRAPRLTKIEQMMRDEVEPKYARIHSYSTQLSPFKAQYGGRSYTLPPVSKQEVIFMSTDECVAHFSGLGYTMGMEKSLEAAEQKMFDLNAAKRKSVKSGKGFFGKLKKTTPSAQEVKTYSTISKREFFNKKFAEARVPLRYEFLPSEEFSNSSDWYAITPSGETGQPQLELERWAEKHWKNVPYKPWRDEIIDMPESAMW